MRRSTCCLTSFAALVLASLGGQWCTAAPTFTLSGLGDLSSPPEENHAYSINSSGQIAGYGFVGDVDHAFLWTPNTPNGTSGSLLDLGNDPNNMRFTQAMNDLGQVAGMHALPSNTLLWTPATPNGTTGLQTDIGDLPTGHGDTFVYGINSFGQITGQSSVAGLARAFLWTPNAANGAAGTWKDLGSLGAGTQATAKAINAKGQVTGAAIIGTTSHAFVWSPTTPNATSGTMVDIGDLPGGNNYGVGMGMNAGGQVVGYSFAAPGIRAFLWTPAVPNGSAGAMINLGTLPGDDASFASSINHFGYVVGRSSFNNNVFATHAFIWSPASGMLDLNTLLDGNYPGWTLYSGESINDYGQITGTAIYDPDGPGGVEPYSTGYVLTPPAPLPALAIPEPGTIALMALAAATLLRRRQLT